MKEHQVFYALKESDVVEICKSDNEVALCSRDYPGSKYLLIA